MALAEALKSNTNLKDELRPAAMPSGPPAHAFSTSSSPPKHCIFNALAPSHPSFCSVRSLRDNNLGPEALMVLAEALKSNNTLGTLKFAALPSNSPIHAFSPQSMHPQSLSALAPS